MKLICFAFVAIFFFDIFCVSNEAIIEENGNVTATSLFNETGKKAEENGNTTTPASLMMLKGQPEPCIPVANPYAFRNRFRYRPTPPISPDEST